ncbi:MAG: alginate O-acetyltransferase complex protein AlgI [Clostridiales bacterium]|nr:alginate O-acetyltransferase complex protein AlgI [Clostridiales bacterium]
MLFSSIVFLFWFLPIVLGVYYVLLRKTNSRNAFLFFSSLFFYAWGEPKFVLVMLLSIFANWQFGLAIDRVKVSPRRRLLLTLAVSFNLLIIFIFKYLTFFAGIFFQLSGVALPIPEITLPIGISFFTFQAISYIVDVYRGKGVVQKSWLHVGLYIAFFPQLIAGPIVRYQTIADQINHRVEHLDDFSEGVTRFIAGLGKKVLIANQMALVADAAFSSAAPGASFAWLGALAYTFQIYYDFSGYSDMAIGLGKMFGFHFDENFNDPYRSNSVSEFWRRWHISLGSWFRDYVYIPLGGSRSKLYRNLFVVWALTGLWHGASWNFVIWGLYYFVLIAFEKALGHALDRIPDFIRVGVTFLAVLLGWVLFRAPTLTAAAHYFGQMFSFSNGDTLSFMRYFTEKKLFFMVAVLLSIPSVRKYRTRFAPLYVAELLLIFALAVSFLLKNTYNPFIYFNF